MDYKAMGSRIQQRRKRLGITQEQLAEKTGVSTSFIGHIERGTQIPSVETLWKICRAIGCSMDTVITKNIVAKIDAKLQFVQ